MDEEPLVRVLLGTPSEIEIAALVAVLTTRSTVTDTRPRPALPSAWVRSARPAGRPPSWRASGLPR